MRKRILYIRNMTPCEKVILLYLWVGKMTSCKAIQKLVYAIENDPHMLQHPKFPHENAFQLLNIGFHNMSTIEH